MEIHVLTTEEIEDMLTRAAERGAKEALGIVEKEGIVYLKDLAKKHCMSFKTLKQKRVNKHIPKVDGTRSIAILSKYVPELLAS